MTDKEQQKHEKQHEDMKKIMAAAIDARDKGEASRLIVDFSDNGGVLAIIVESKKRYK